jgi:hypothetical protein
MARGLRTLPDWRDGAAYDPLRKADRAILAWEWLRRDPGYRSAVARAGDGYGEARAWGLHRFEDPARGAPDARPMWTARLYGAVLYAEPGPQRSADAIDLARLGDLLSSCETARTGDASGLRLLISDGWRVIRLDLAPASGWPGPLAIRFVVAGPPRLAPQLLGLQRFESLVRTGRFVAALHRPPPRVARHVLLLRTADALAAGARQREIAAALVDRAAAEVDWRDKRPELRLRAQRLVRDARACAGGGWRALLSGRGAQVGGGGAVG